MVNYASDRTGAESVVDGIVASGGRAKAVQADVAKAADVARLFEQVYETFGSVDIWSTMPEYFRRCLSPS